MNIKQLERTSVTFEQDDYDIPPAIEYYVGIENPTITSCYHPDNLWTILDRMETMIMDTTELDDEEQKKFLFYFVGKWKKEIEPYCVRLESE